MRGSVTIPGWPHSGARRAGRLYPKAEQHASRLEAILTQHDLLWPAHCVSVTIELYYAFDQPLAERLDHDISQWPNHGIPNADTAAAPALAALAATIVPHKSHLNPVRIERIILSRLEAEAKFGLDGMNGATVITWEAT